MSFKFPVIPLEPRLFYVETVYERIEKLLADALRKLKEGQNLLVDVPLSSGRVILLSYFGYQNPNFIIVYGEDENGREVKAFLQHTNIEIIATVIEKPMERKAIGFKGQITNAEI